MLLREHTVLTLIYARQPSEQRVLLGLKKRGFGEGKLNGYGGKLEPGENVEECAARELLEEAKLVVALEDLRWCGVMTYIYDTKPKAMNVHVYDFERWVGEPQETEEMKPVWYSHGDIPLQEMWADDAYWLVQYLDGHLPLPFRGRFRFKGHEGADSCVVLEHAVETLAPKPNSLSPSPGTIAAAHPGAALIVTTVSFSQAPGGNAHPLESFIRYHLLRGFAHILIFIDSADDEAALSSSRKFPRARVTVYVRGKELLEEQRRRCNSFAQLGPLHETEVSARQMLDAELAMLLAPELRCSWVVCLDSDELFYTAEDSVVPHFEALVSQGVDQMTYLNHEAVPEILDTQDYFATTTLFRRHHFAVPLSAEARDGLRFWMDRSKRGQYLLFYDNGKSACRAGLGARPLSQHLWQLPEGYRSRTALADPRRLDVEGYFACADPCVLHFPVCGLGWLHAKYTTLGDFPDSWLGGKVKLPASFHSDCREACAAGESTLENLFKTEVLLDDPAEAKRQVASGVCLRITGHANVLESLPSPVLQEDAPTPTTRVAERPSAESARAGGPQGIERGWILSKSMDWL